MLRWLCELLGLLSLLSSIHIRFGYGVELVIGCISGLNDVDSNKVLKFIVSCPGSELCFGDLICSDFLIVESWFDIC